MEDKLLESIKNLSYFNKAREWYYHRYLSCIIERSWLLLIVIFLLICVLLLSCNIYSVFSVKEDSGFVRYMDYDDDELPIKKRLSASNKEDASTSVARYLIKKYIETYESYRVIQPPFQDNFIKNNSVHKVYTNFQEKVNNSVGTDKREVLNVNVKSLSINKPNNMAHPEILNGDAIVDFSTQKGKEIKSKTVTISFTLSDVQYTMRGIIPLQFLIKDYKLV